MLYTKIQEKMVKAQKNIQQYQNMPQEKPRNFITQSTCCSHLNQVSKKYQKNEQNQKKEVFPNARKSKDSALTQSLSQDIPVQVLQCNHVNCKASQIFIKYDIENLVILVSLKNGNDKNVRLYLAKQNIQQQIVFKDNTVVMLAYNYRVDIYYPQTNTLINKIEKKKHILKFVVRNQQDVEKLKKISLFPKIFEKSQPKIKQNPETQPINFSLPPIQNFQQQQNLRKLISSMNSQSKIQIIQKVYKVKKQFKTDDKKEYRCPVFSCQKQYITGFNFRNHLNKQHPELEKNGIKLNDNNEIDFDHRALDLALYLGKIIPGQIKKVIKLMKTKPE